MSQDRSSTIGRERRTNYALQAKDKKTFVELLTSELPERPGYFASDVELNRTGAPLLAELTPLVALQPADVREAQERGAVVLDVRDEDAFGAAHVPEAVNIGLDGQFASWAGSIVGLQTDLVILAENDEQVAEARVRLARVGIERIAGFASGGMRAWAAAGLPVAVIPQLDPDAFAAAMRDPRVQIVDVRRDSEWDAGHIAGAVHVPLNALLGRLDELDRSRPLAVHCKSGYRSAIATSLLARAGFRETVNLRGGFDAWCEAGRQPEPATL